jgi:FAS-associated factor 2
MRLQRQEEEEEEEEEERSSSDKARSSASGKRKTWPDARSAAGSAVTKKQKKTERRDETEAADGTLARRLQEEEEDEERRSAYIRRVGTAPPRAAAERPASTRQWKDEGRSLREEQDAEYERSLLADQIRDIERGDAEERVRRRRKMEEEEEEDGEAERRQRDAAMAGKGETIAAAIAEEPPATALGVGVATLRFAIPDGRKFDRRFLPEDVIRNVRAYLLVRLRGMGVNVRNVGLATNFPRREFGDGDDDLTLEEAGLAPRAMVMVRDLDA